MPERTQDDGFGDALADALLHANLPTLLLVLYQLTGDERYLESPFLPTRPRGLSDSDDGGLPADLREEIIERAQDAIIAFRAGASAISIMDADVARMLSVSVGERVSNEFASMITSDIDTSLMTTRVGERQPLPFSVAVIGGGISGLMAAKQLKDLGVPCRVFERNDRIGGTWYENQYPGAGVDTPSYLYSMAAFPRDWSTRYAPQTEVLRYIEDFVDAHALRPLVTLGSEVRSIQWDEGDQKWRISIRYADGVTRVGSADIVISAVGQLNVPNPAFPPGAETFRGALFHSARWPHDLDVTDKRVAVVGSGASAMQIVPAIAAKAGRVEIFQRSPQWIAPSEDHFDEIPEQVHWLMRHVPFYAHWYRARLAWIFNDRVHDSLQIDPKWPEPATAVNATNDRHRQYFTDYLTTKLAAKPELIAASLPSYPPFGKRMLLDNGWFDALLRDNVNLVPSGVSRITETGVVDDRGDEVEIDIIVLATGFQARTLLGSFEAVGREGRTLREIWGDEDASAYLGITIPNFPNLFLMYGPHSSSGHGGSYITIAECQLRYISDLIEQMGTEGIAVIEPRDDVVERYNAAVDDAHNRMIWSHRGMSTWYRNAAGRVISNMPWRIVDYWNMTRRADLHDYRTTPIHSNRHGAHSRA